MVDFIYVISAAYVFQLLLKFIMCVAHILS